MIVQSRLDTTDRLRDGSPRRLEAVCEGVECLGGEPGESVPMMIGRADMMPVSIHVTEQYTGDQDIKYACMFDKVKLEDVGCCLCRRRS